MAMPTPAPKKSAKKSPQVAPLAASKNASPAGNGADGSAEALAEFLAEAQAIPARDVRPFRGDAALAFHNVDAGLAAVAAREAELSALPAPFDVAAMRSLRKLALAVVYAAAQVDRSSPGTTRKRIARASELRDLLLTNAVALMKSGVLPEPKVKKILAGKGTRDLAQDCVDLAQLFRDNAAALKGKTAVTKAQIDEAARVGNELIATLQPSRGKARVPAEVKSAVDTRDRVWTLLWTRHKEQLRRAGMWLWIDDIDRHVPPLLSNTGPKKKAPKKDASAAGVEG
jgi:hypothetical protein